MEIMLDVLSAMGKGEHLKTRIMYWANLNHTSLMKYFGYLMDGGLVEKKGKRYFLTKAGKRCLRNGISFAGVVGRTVK